MKKTLLLLSLGCVSGMMSAEMVAPKIFAPAVFQKMTPDGRYVVSEMYGMVQIFDLVENKSYDYFDENANDMWSVGIGNSFNEQCVLVGSAQTESNAAYWQNGKWYSLPLTGEEKNTNIANAITPDGSRICGTVSIVEMTLDDATMTVPVLWQRNAEGTYDNYIVLPHPEADHTGRAPQYISAISISPDGKAVAGTVTDCQGRLITPIVYTENENGEWSYSLPMSQFINPENIEIPENPGEYPEWPDAKKYMTPEEVAAYEAAYDEWVQNFYQGDMPEYADYMTAEEKAQYEAAYTAWQEEAAVFEEKQTVYLDALEEICNTSVSCLDNNVFFSPDGKSIAVTAVTFVPDPDSWIPGGTKDVDHVWTIDLASGAIQKYEDCEAHVNNWYPDGTIVAWGNLWGENPESYLLKDGKSTSFYDYLTSINPELKAWVDENMKHVVEIYDWETEEVIQQEGIYVGVPVFSADMKTVASFTSTSAWAPELMYEGYVFDLAQFDGVNSAVAAADLQVSLNEAGDIVVNGVAATLEVYNLQGVCVASAANVSGVVNVNLANGVYVVKAVSAAGVVNVAKVVK
ncbi:MAG: T9SS type A sorting domain-containing protein [Muribaculaceae bacterium]|nr:T9SS type A sorting domain-containing protein [Muribaculaceae bacterium]